MQFFMVLSALVAVIWEWSDRKERKHSDYHNHKMSKHFQEHEWKYNSQPNHASKQLPCFLCDYDIAHSEIGWCFWFDTMCGLNWVHHKPVYHWTYLFLLSSDDEDSEVDESRLFLFFFFSFFFFSFLFFFSFFFFLLSCKLKLNKSGPSLPWSITTRLPFHHVCLMLDVL